MSRKIDHLADKRDKPSSLKEDFSALKKNIEKNQNVPKLTEKEKEKIREINLFAKISEIEQAREVWGETLNINLILDLMKNYSLFDFGNLYQLGMINNDYHFLMGIVNTIKKEPYFDLNYIINVYEIDQSYNIEESLERSKELFLLDKNIDFYNITDVWKLFNKKKLISKEIIEILKKNPRFSFRGMLDLKELNPKISFNEAKKNISEIKEKNPNRLFGRQNFLVFKEVFSQKKDNIEIYKRFATYSLTDNELLKLFDHDTKRTALVMSYISVNYEKKKDLILNYIKNKNDVQSLLLKTKRLTFTEGKEKLSSISKVLFEKNIIKEDIFELLNNKDFISFAEKNYADKPLCTIYSIAIAVSRNLNPYKEFSDVLFHLEKIHNKRKNFEELSLLDKETTAFLVTHQYGEFNPNYEGEPNDKFNTQGHREIFSKTGAKTSPESLQLRGKKSFEYVSKKITETSGKQFLQITCHGNEMFLMLGDSVVSFGDFFMLLKNNAIKKNGKSELVISLNMCKGYEFIQNILYLWRTNKQLKDAGYLPPKIIVEGNKNTDVVDYNENTYRKFAKEKKIGTSLTGKDYFENIEGMNWPIFNENDHHDMVFIDPDEQFWDVLNNPEIGMTQLGESDSHFKT